MGTKMLHCPTLAPPSGHCASMLSKAVRAFDCHQAGVRDPNAGNLDLPPAHPHGLAVRRSKAVLDQVGYHIDVEPMADQRRPGAAAQSCVGEHFERAPLLSAETNPRHTNAPQRQKVLADRICHLTVCANRAAPFRNNTLKIIRNNTLKIKTTARTTLRSTLRGLLPLELNAALLLD
jgi:hypothetical protein